MLTSLKFVGSFLSPDSFEGTNGQIFIVSYLSQFAFIFFNDQSTVHTSALAKLRLIY